MDILNDITKTTVKLLIKEAFYGHFFTYIHRTISTKVERVSLSLSKEGRLTLSFNPNYWKSLNEEEKFGSIKHQILHLIFRHIYRKEQFGNQAAFHMASDLVVNQYLTKAQQGLGAFVVEDFPFLNLKLGESVDYYYKRLKESLRFDESSRANASSDDNSEQKEGEQSGKNQNSAHESDDKKEGEQGGSGGDPRNEHKEWDSFDEQKGAQKKFVEEKLDTYVKQSAERVSSKDFGLLPAGLRSHIEEAKERLKPSVHWKRLLRLYLQTSSKTYVKSTMKRPSRRYGTVPGIQIKQRQKILVTIDTSGSINQNELSVFFSEIHHIWRQSAEIEIVECDFEIQSRYKYTGHCPEVVSGGGGTSLDPPIELANKIRPDVLIYFTDAHANPPSVHNNVPIIWVVTAEGKTTEEWDFLPGRKIKLSS